jgi:hypothetical protein
MKKLFSLIAFFATASCMNASTGNGLLYTETSEIIYYDPYVKPNQKTTMCAKNFVGLVAFGDASLYNLQQTSTIRKISSIEKTYSSRFSLIGEACTIVKGE